MRKTEPPPRRRKKTRVGARPEAVTIDTSRIETAKLTPSSFDACITDPPYGLEFMGQGWDRCVPPVEIWKRIFDALKPGAYMMAFGGTRTFHRLTCNIEDAGFEIRDCLVWLYGSGFPKSLDVSKALDKEAGARRKVVGTRKLGGTAALSTKENGGTYSANVSGAGRSVTIDVTEPATDLARQWSGYGTALKPAWEPIILARKPLDGTVASNVRKHGCGGLNIDASRIGTDVMAKTKSNGTKVSGNRSMAGHNTGRVAAVGRWPANVVLDESAAAMLDEQTGNRKSKPFRANVAAGSVLPMTNRTAGGYEDEGGASRFYYVAKASRAERDAGLDDLETKPAGQKFGSIQDGRNQAGADYERPGMKNVHPTVKPRKLIEHLAKLIRPANDGARLLVPFSGSGSEILGALDAGWTDIHGIECSEEYVAIAKKRIGIPSPKGQIK